jgi:predicted CoA-binding protein
MTDLRQILEASQNILLVDWPNTGVPRTLIEAGFAVYGYSPGGYSLAQVVPDRPDDPSVSVFPPKAEGEAGFLTFRKLDGPPSRVDLVNVYRGEEEHSGIITMHFAPLGAKVLWLEPPITSATARRIAAERGLAFVEGVEIAETTRKLAIRKSPKPDSIT